MLKTFIRFSEVDYCIESQDECLEEVSTNNCEEYFETKMIAKASDVISFIVSKSDYELYINSIHLKAALTSCGIVTELDIAAIEQSDSQYYFTCTLPSDLENGEYEITIYKDYQLQILDFTPETTDGACDATFTVGVISAPAIDFEFSIDGISWNDTGVFTGLCAQEYTILVREVGDTDCTSGTLTFETVPLDCSDYKGWTLQQFIDSGIFMIQLKDCTIEDLST